MKKSRLIEHHYSESGNGNEPSVYSIYLYDSNGQRVKKFTRKDAGSYPYEVTNYVGGNFEHFYDSDSSWNRDSDNDFELFSLMLGNERTNSERYGADEEKKAGDYDSADDVHDFLEYSHDHLGSCILTYQSDDGVLYQREECFPFGEKAFGGADRKRYKFAGKYKDEHSGLIYFGARYCSPWLCRFTSVDPLAMDYPYLTPYNYAGNKPITHKDIDGLQGTGDTPVNTQNQTGTSTGGGAGSGTKTNTDNLKPGQTIQVGSVPGPNGSSLSNGKISGSEPLPPQTFASDATSAVLQPTSNDLSNINSFGEGVADMLRNTPTFGDKPNPFYMAEAISLDAGFSLVGAEGDRGSFFILAGSEKGTWQPYSEIAGGGSNEGGVSIEVGRVDVSGNLQDFKGSADLFGSRDKVWSGAGPVSGSRSFGDASGNRKVETSSIQVGLTASPMIVTGGVNTGKVKKPE